MSETPESAEIEEDVMYNLSSESTPSMAVVTTVAKVTDQSPAAMKPLAEAIDPTALDTMLDGSSENESSITVSFEYCGLQVTATPQTLQLDVQE